MTVVNALKFNDEEAGMVTDSQRSGYNRKDNSAEKTRILQKGEGDNKIIAFLGGTGNSAMLTECYQILEKEIKDRKEINIKELSFLLSRIMVGVKRERINAHLKSTYGLSSFEASTGKVQNDQGTMDINPSLYSKIKEDLVVESELLKKLLHNTFVVIGKDKNGISFYSAGMDNLPFTVSKVYHSVGSGGDASDIILSNYIQKLKREGRDKINLVEGIENLIRATLSSIDVNQGVGGVPTISYFNKSGVTLLNENESILATEIVKVKDAKLLNPRIANAALEDVLFKRASADDIELRYFSDATGRYSKISKFLRGYK